MASQSNPFDAIIAPEREEPPGEALASGISPELPEDINPFDAIGYEAPPEPSYQKVGDYRGAEILQDEGGTWYSSSPEGIIELPEDVKAEVGAELGGLEEPWIDPTTVGFAAGGVGAKLALAAGKGVAKAVGRGAVTGAVAAAAEYPIGAATELVEEKHPGLALPFNIAVGVLSGVTIERAIEKVVLRGLGKGVARGVVKARAAVVREALESGDMSDPVTRTVADEINERLSVATPPKSAEEAAETLRAVKQPERIEPLTAREPWEMTGEELSAFTEETKVFEKNLEKNILGKHYDTWIKAQRSQNSWDKETSQRASSKIEKIESQLDPNDVDKLYGIGETGRSYEELNEYVRAVDDIDMSDTPEELGETLRFAITRIGNQTDPAKMSPEEKIAYTQMAHAMKKATEKGWDTNLISEQAIRSAASRFADPEDAMYMLRRFAKKTPTRPQLKEVNPFDRIAEEVPAAKTASETARVESPETYSLRADLEERFPGLDREEFDYLAREVSKDLDEMGSASPGRGGKSLRQASKDWSRFIDEGWERSTQGKTKGQVLSSLEAFRPKFEEKAGAYLNFKEGDVAAGGLAYGMPLPKYAASVNLERVGADYDTKKLILEVSDKYKGLIDEARRGKMSQEMTRELADNLGMTEKQLLKRRKGRAFNAEEALAARDILNTSADNLANLQRRLAADGTEENLALFKMAMDRHAAVQAEVSGAATEAGRALSAHRIQSAKNARVAKNYKRMLDVLGADPEDTDRIAKYFGTIDPTDQQAVNKFIMEMSEATTSEKIFEAWVNGLLSGPQTHVVNTTSNALTFLSGIPERATGAVLDLFRAGVTRAPRERFFGETPHHIYGAWQGMKEGVRAGLKAFASEIPTEDAMKLEVPRKMAIKGKKGRIVRIPGRSLMAMDEFFKAINYRSELHSLAFRQAAKEGKKGPARAERIAEIVGNPSDELKGKATEEMLYRVFQKELGPTGKALTKLRTDTPGLKYIIPFLKTPTNIAKFGIERTPLSVARYPKMFKQLMKGEIDASQITDEMAKTLMGSMIGLAAFMYAKEGNITGGGPKNKAEREALYRTGWQPYSLKVGGKYYSYGRLEPLGIIIGTAADASEIWDVMGTEDQENIAALLATSVAKNLTSKTFMKGLSDALNATTDPERYGAHWVQNFAGTAVPSVVAASARAVDPELKEVQSIVDKWKSRLPGMTGDLYSKRDIWGKAIERDLSGLAALTTPVYVSEEKGTKADQEIVRLGVRMSKPSRKIKDRKKEIELSPGQYDELVVEAGAEAKRRVDRFVNGSSYDGVREDLKGKMIKRLYDGAIEVARKRLMLRLRKEQ